MDISANEKSALDYAERGFAVFPLIPGQKQPATAHGLKDASKDPKVIHEWWQKNPDYNVAIATGQVSGGLVVIDVDNGHGGNGSESLKKWCSENGKFPETLTCFTGTGGFHFYYFDDQVFTNKTHLIDSVDVRADGGYIVAPPSVHPNGKPYIWIREDPIPRNDPTVRKFLSTAKKKEQQQPVETEGKYPQGRRTDSLIRLIGTLVDRGLSPEAVRQAVIAENKLRCNPPLSDEEMEREVLPSINGRGWISTKPYVRNDEIRRLPEPVNLLTTWDDPPPLAPVLIEGVLRKGHKMIISAPSKAGKSFALMRLAIGIAEGFKWFGAKCRQGKVLYLNMEIDDPSCINRFKNIYEKLGMNEGIHVENITLWGLRGFSMPLSELVPKIVERAGHDYDAIIIDPLYKVMDGDENSNTDIGRMVGQFDRIARETGASVIYAHHFAKGKGGDKDVIDRGAGAGTFSRDPDAILTMTQLDVEGGTPDRTAWRVEFVLREFPQHLPVNVWWEYPLHVIDPGLDEEELKQSNPKKRDKESQKQERINNVRRCARKVMKNGKLKVSDFRLVYDEFESLSLNSAKNRLREAGFAPEEVEDGRQPFFWEFKGVRV